MIKITKIKRQGRLYSSISIYGESTAIQRFANFGSMKKFNINFGNIKCNKMIRNTQTANNFFSSHQTIQ